MDRDLAHKMMLDARGVQTPCSRCHGSGVLMYANTATWRGGVGGSAITPDVCNKCWGTGDMHRTGMNLKEVESKLRKLKRFENPRPWTELCLHCDFGHDSKQCTCTDRIEAK